MLPLFFPLAKDELSFVLIFLLRMLSSLLLSSLLGGLLVNVSCTAKLVLMKVLIKEKRKILPVKRGIRRYRRDRFGIW